MLKKIEAGNYEYTDSNGLVWIILNHGYTRGYACVMWRGHKRDEPPTMLRKEIWGYSRKDVIDRIQRRVVNGSE